jgi:hypothetical protein
VLAGLPDTRSAAGNTAKTQRPDIAGTRCSVVALAADNSEQKLVYWLQPMRALLERLNDLANQIEAAKCRGGATLELLFAFYRSQMGSHSLYFPRIPFQFSLPQR